MLLHRVTTLIIAGILSVATQASLAEDQAQHDLGRVLNAEQANRFAAEGLFRFPLTKNAPPQNIDDNPSFEDINTKTGVGIFKVGTDGKVCVDLADYENQCGILLHKGDVLFLLTDGGSRLPIYFRLGGE